MFINKKCLKAIFSVKPEQLAKSKKECKFLKSFFKLSLDIYPSLRYYIHTTCQFNSHSMDRPDKRKTARDSRFVG